MPKVPRTTTLTETPAGIPEIPTPGFTAEDFGARQAEALGVAGRAVSEVAGVMQRVQERRDVSKVLDLASGLVDGVNKRQPEYLLRKKNDAEDVTRQAEADWDKAYAQASAGLSSRQLNLLRQRTVNTRLGHLRAVSSHEANEGRAASISAKESAMAAAAGNAAINATDPEIVAEQRNEVVRLSAATSDELGDSDEDAERRSGQSLVKFHTEVIQSLARTAPDQAEAYYKEYKDDIPGDSRDDIEKLVFQSTSTARAQQAGDDAITKFDSVDAALADMRKKTKKGEQRSVNEDEIKARFAEKDAQHTREQNDLFEQAQDALQKGGRWADIPADVVARMDGKTRAALDKFVENPLGPDKTAWDRFYELSKMPDAALAKVNLSMEMELREVDRNKLLARQKAFLTGKHTDSYLLDERTRSLLNTVFKQLDWGDGDNENKGNLEEYVGRIVSFETAAKGAKLTTPEIRNIIYSAVLEGETPGEGFLSFFYDPDKLVFELSEKEILEFTPDKIPPDVERDLRATIYRAGGYVLRGTNYVHKDTGVPARPLTSEDVLDALRAVLIARKRALYAF